MYIFIACIATVFAFEVLVSVLAMKTVAGRVILRSLCYRSFANFPGEVDLLCFHSRSYTQSHMLNA